MGAYGINRFNLILSIICIIGSLIMPMGSWVRVMSVLGWLAAFFAQLCIEEMFKEMSKED